MVREVVGNRGLMQTFLPFADFEMSARSLDTKRLGKQRVECIQVVRGLVRPGYGWRHHRAVEMWRCHEEALGRYGLTCCDVWLSVVSSTHAPRPVLFHRGTGTRTSTAATARRCSARTPTATGTGSRTSRTSRTTWTTCGRGVDDLSVAAASGRVLPGTASCTGALADAGMTADQSIRQPPRMPK